jgi:putative heme degradation protein
MICTLTTRKIKPGAAQQFAATMDGAMAGMPEEFRNRWKHVYICQDVNDEDTMLSFGFFDGTLEELRAVQAASHRDELVSRSDSMIEEILLDGSYEVIAEVQNQPATGATAS